MKVLLVGSGAREHAIARAIKKSRHQPSLFCFGSSTNPGIKELSADYRVGKMDDVEAMAKFASERQVDWAIVGPEAPLAAGVVDVFQSINVPAVGPSKELAQLETSKSFTRDLMTEYDIPGCPKYKYFSNINGVDEFLRKLGDDYVVKADGLMGGKGVKVAGDHLHSHQEALDWCKEIIDKGQGFVLEEKLVGQEFSYISLSDGQHLAHTFAIQDHKRAFVGDKGPNTGGMGSYSDTDHLLPFLTLADVEDAQAINLATMKALKAKFGQDYKGVLYGGFMATKNGVKLIEYNARFGDPEAMNIFALLDSDFVETCQAIIAGDLNQKHFTFKNQASVCKYVVPEGYPDNPVKNEKVDVSEVENVECLYYAAVDQRSDGLYETGSRAIAVVGVANTIAAAENIAEAEVSKIKGPLFHREDIGTAELIQKRVEMMRSL